MWIKKIREVLKLLGEELDILHEFLDDFPFYWTDSSEEEAKALCQRATVAYREALAAIPTEDPMMKLLQLFEDWCAGIGEIGRVLTDDDKILIGVIRQTIEREFGYKLPEEGDSGKENDSSPQA